ncbi:hypothetical protein SOM26_00160 [Sphingomonas sp. CFBP8993]|uniref:hypothetical protein n=1 Tax=Sphingomonas sp. CFBP8993 TaxID=3096526 RepID=UPI002A6993B2|nr:hypothetical protein [Sphingomonas sp. CFBP8993]MDY0957092.1 hypothetical protein [Sphingomonas sp. CFBP8993]
MTAEHDWNIERSQQGIPVDRRITASQHPEIGTIGRAVAMLMTELDGKSDGYGRVNMPGQMVRQEADIMMIVVSVLVFTGALVAAIATIAVMIAPQWRRILHLATGHVEPAFTPLATLVVAERRIAVRRWAAGSPALSPLSRRRVAA